MGIFNKIFGEKKCSCSCEKKTEKLVEENILEKDELEIRVLDSGCKCCQNLEKNTLEVTNELGIKTKVKHITDFSEIAKYGIMSTPGLWIDGKVVSYGKVLSKDEIKIILKKITEK